MKRILLTAGVSIVLLLGACGGSEEETGYEQAAVDDGKAIYRSASCFSCHGADLEVASGPNLQEVAVGLSEDEIRTVNDEGTDVMPGGLDEDAKELDALAAGLAEQK